MSKIKPQLTPDVCQLRKRCLCHGLPPRQRQVLHRVLAGDAEKQIANAIGISQHTVHVCGRMELMALALRSTHHPRAIRHSLGLTFSQRDELERLLAQSGVTRKQLRHAKILLACDGRSDDYDISSCLDVSIRTIERVRKEFLAGGLAAAVAPRFQTRRTIPLPLAPIDLIVAMSA